MEPTKQNNPYAAPQSLSMRAKPKRPYPLRDWRRALATAVCLLGGAALIHFGFQGLTINDLPAQYLGYFLAGFAALALLGVNLWRGGILDPRHDDWKPKVLTTDLEVVEDGRRMASKPEMLEKFIARPLGPHGRPVRRPGDAGGEDAHQSAIAFSRGG